MAVIFITHDLGIVRRFADRVYVMRAGVVVEHGPVARIFAKPSHDYTKMLLAAEPEGTKPPVPDTAQTAARCRQRLGQLPHSRRPLLRRRLRAEGRRPRVADAACRADDRHRRRIRVRKIHARARAPAAHPERRRDPLRGARPEGARPEARALAAARAAARVPGSVRLAVAAPHRRADRDRGPARARADDLAGGARQSRRAGAQGGAARPRHAQPLPARILRRAAPAHRHRAHDDPEAQGRRARRADLGARPLGAEGDRRAPAQAAGGRTSSPTSSSATTSPWCARWPTRSSS